MGLIPNDLLPTVISFLTPEERTTYGLVCRRWRWVCVQAKEHEIQEWIHKWEGKRQRRTQQRNILLQKEKLDQSKGHYLDHKLGDAWKDILKRKAGLLELVPLLDQGAVPQFVFDSNRETYMYQFISGRGDSEAHAFIFPILAESLASPCQGWWLGSNCDANDRVANDFHIHVLRYAIHGVHWGVDTFALRWEAWKLFRLMVYMADQNQNNESDNLQTLWGSLGYRGYGWGAPYRDRTLHGFLLRFLDFVTLKESKDNVRTILRSYPKLRESHQRMTAHRLALDPKKNRLFIILHSSVHDNSHRAAVYLKLWEKCAFPYFWSRKTSQKEFYKMLASSHALRTFVKITS